MMVGYICNTRGFVDAYLPYVPIPVSVYWALFIGETCPKCVGLTNLGFHTMFSFSDADIMDFSCPEK